MRYFVLTLMNLVLRRRLLPIAPLLGGIPMSSPPVTLLLVLLVMMLFARLMVLACREGTAVTTALIRAEEALMLSPLFVAHALRP